jgi:hypothetical protein
MVVTRLLEVTTKGSEWVNAQSTSSPGKSTASTSGSQQRNTTLPDPSPSSSSSFWTYATTSLQDMASTTIGSMVSSLYGGGSCVSTPVNYFNIPSSQQPMGIAAAKHVKHPLPQPTSYIPNVFNFNFWRSSGSMTSTPSAATGNTFDEFDYSGNEYEEDVIIHPNHQHRRRSSIFAFSNNYGSPWLGNNSSSSGKSTTPHSDLVWMFRNNKNPYNAVRGRESQLSSLTAVRSLVALVSTSVPAEALMEESEKSHFDGGSPPSPLPIDQEPPPPPPYEMIHDDSITSRDHDANYRRATKQQQQQQAPSNQIRIGVSTPSETASQLAEGTIRALRDLALEEAVELQSALRYWNYRWERPLLSWLEAGPFGSYLLYFEYHVNSYTQRDVFLIKFYPFHANSLDVSVWLQSPSYRT